MGNQPPENRLRFLIFLVSMRVSSFAMKRHPSNVGGRPYMMGMSWNHHLLTARSNSIHDCVVWYEYLTMFPLLHYRMFSKCLGQSHYIPSTNSFHLISGQSCTSSTEFFTISCANSFDHRRWEDQHPPTSLYVLLRYCCTRPLKENLATVAETLS